MFMEKHIPLSIKLQVQNKFIICQSRKVFVGMDIFEIFHLCSLIKFSTSPAPNPPPQFHKASITDQAFIDLETKLKYLITY